MTNIRIEAAASEVGSITPDKSHASIGDLVVISGSGFGSEQGTSKVYFGELPQYTFSDDVVARPCTREAASYTSWNDTQIGVTVPSMSPGLAGATGTYHNVYVEVGGTPTNAASFYIDPVTTLDANSSEAAWATVFPNSVVTVEDNTYTNSTSPHTSKHASYTTHVTLDATSGARPWGGNYVAASSYNVLIKDVTFVTDVGDDVISPDDAGVLTLGQIAAPTEGGYWPAADQYNLTFHNCVILNQMSVYSDGQGMNGIKAFHNTGADRHGDWTFSDCSIGTPNSPDGCFRRMGIELVEYTGGLSPYTSTNHLNNIAFVGCDFEPPGVMPYSFAVYGRGPDRNLLIDDCLMKGSGPGNVGWGSSCIEYSGYGLVVKDTDIWATRSGCFSWEGDGDGTGGLSMAGYQCHRLVKDCTLDMTHQYHSVAAIGDHWLFDASTELDYAVFDNCDFNVGNATNHIRAMHYGGDTGWSSCNNWDMSTSYVHGTATDVGSTGDGIDYWRNTWNASDPVTTYGYNSGTNTDANGNVYPQVGTRP